MALFHSAVKDVTDVVRNGGFLSFVLIDGSMIGLGTDDEAKLRDFLAAEAKDTPQDDGDLAYSLPTLDEQTEAEW